MERFTYQNTSRLEFGEGRHQEVGTLLSGLANKVLLLYGGGSIFRTGLHERVCASLKEAGVAYCELGGVHPNPGLAKIREGVELCRKEGVDFLLAVGGGSVIDSAKTIAVSVYLEGDAWELYESGREAQRALPLATLLTLPATGTEFNGDAVLSNEETNQKLCFSSDLVRPVFSILDPALFTTLPVNQIANGVCDIMSHILERYLSATENTAYIDGLCESSLRALLHHAPFVLSNPADTAAWGEISLAGAVANNGLLGLGREQDWACHDMEHEISARYPGVFHGAGLAVITPAWMEYVWREHPSLFGRFGRRVMGTDCGSDEADAKEGILRLRAFFRSLGLPATLSQLGVAPAELEGMARRVTGAESGEGHTVGAVKPLNWRDVLSIYRLADKGEVVS